MTNVTTLNREIFNNDNASAFTKFLVEFALESPEFDPPNFCIIAPSYMLGGYGHAGGVHITGLDQSNPASLAEYVGRLHAELSRATEALKYATEMEAGND